MEPKSEPMDKSFENKSEALKEEGSPSGKPPPVKKDEKPHRTHSFNWKSVEQKTILLSCNSAGTVEDSLKRNRPFKGIAKKNQGKELVLLRNGKAICSHFPCSLIKDECLTVKFIKAVNKPGEKAGGSAHVRRKGSSDEVVVFHVRMKGGEGIKRILKNPDLKKDVDEMTIFAYKGEKVKQALRRDARFLDIVFKKKCMLSTDVSSVDMSNLVDDLGGKTYTITEDKNLPDSQPSSLEEDLEQSAESQRPEAEENQDPSEQSVNDNTNTSGHKVAEQTREPISEEMRIHLSSQIENFMKRKKTVPFLDGDKKLLMTKIMSVEFGKNAQTCTEVRTMKKLMGFSNSVCQVRINGRPAGSGFLLFDRFVLTNAHVVKNVYNDSKKELNAEVTVHFSYESLNQTEREQDSVADVVVEEVAGFEYTEKVYDWALLKLRAGVNLPPALLNKCGYVNQSHGVCIIGHPDGGVKRIDPCLSIAPEKRNQVVEKSWVKNQDNTKLITDRFFEGVALSVMRCKHFRTYKTSFYEGASGSPVFDQDCNVLAMHSGGYLYKDEKTDTTKSVIEFGYPTSDVVERIIIQLVEREKFDVLKGFLDSKQENLSKMKSNVKKLVESRNLETFKAVVRRPVADKNIKEFFEFFRQNEEPVPMDTC
ncbi:serine protease FAM111A isoform X2 [Pleuronectes platessa]|uniref:serine protease FAM111A isoform X2 n=1 Tax=Pleuronectes platessa TaxID=8262 RepID=UPI00232A6B8B|nr:serine protease FAM111A isoform X2 [Pleuronectes platessa]XP_053298303.1 serine protease FAM111A isoform X2 [Pleuronectes platessa]